MKNKKGFTLIEILTVIGLMSIIFIIAIPAISNIRKSIMIRELESKKETIVSAAEVYAQNNQSLFPKEGGIIQIPVRTLLYYGYINEDSTDCDDAIGCVMNPVNNTSMNNEIITIKKIKSVTQATFGEVNEHVITFHANGATSVGGSSNFISIGCDTFTNSTCTIRVPSIERDGFTKVGFGESANSTSADYLVGQDILFNDNISNNDVKSDYYAITKKDIEVTFNANGGVFTEGGDTLIRNCTIQNSAQSCSILSQEPSVSRSGYEKKSGWFSSEEGIETVNISQVIDNISAYAQWKENCGNNTFNEETGKCEYTASLDRYDCPDGGTPNASNICQLSPTTKYMCYQNAPIIYNCICYKDGYGDMYFSGGNVDWRTATLCQGMCTSNSWSYVSFSTTYGSCPAGTQPSGSMCLDYTPRSDCSGWTGYWNTSSECSAGTLNSSYCEYSGTPVYTCPTTGPHNDVELNNTTCSYTP